MMDAAHEKGNETRRRNTEKRLALLEEQTAAIRAARTALTRVLESPDITPDQILQAAELLKFSPISILCSNLFQNAPKQQNCISTKKVIKT